MNATKEQIERGCELVYEKVTGKCWHVFTKTWQGVMVCYKCDDFHANPSLSTSLDAWAEHIWPVMTDEMKNEFDWKLDFIWSGNICDLTAIMLLEAALRALNLYDEVMV